MAQSEKIKNYTHKVCSQIRWKKAHDLIADELENHITDQTQAFIAQGDDKETAENKAILDMGDPVEIGTLLDHTHRPKHQWQMISLAVILLVMGIFITTFVTKNSNLSFHYVTNQTFFALIGIVVMLLVYFADFSLIGKYPKMIYGSILIFSVIMLLLSPKVNGRSFFIVGSFAFLCSYLPLLFPLAFVAAIYIMRNRGYVGILLCGVSYLPLAFVSAWIPSFSGLFVFTVTALILLCTAICKNWFGVKKSKGLLFVLVPSIMFTFSAIAVSPNVSYLLNRLYSAVNTYADPQGAGYIPSMLRAMIENSKFIGSGTVTPDLSQVLTSFPDLNTDYVITNLIFKTGWVSFIIVAVVLSLFIIKGFYLCLKQKSVLGQLVSSAVMLTLTLETLGYILSNFGLRIFGSLALPLISYGNTAMIVNMALIGCMLSVFRSGDAVNDKKNVISSPKKYILVEKGKLIIDFNK